jgi:hypothetical protein
MRMSFAARGDNAKTAPRPADRSEHGHAAWHDDAPDARAAEAAAERAQALARDCGSDARVDAAAALGRRGWRAGFFDVRGLSQDAANALRRLECCRDVSRTLAFRLARLEAERGDLLKLTRASLDDGATDGMDEDAPAVDKRPTPEQLWELKTDLYNKLECVAGSHAS